MAGRRWIAVAWGMAGLLLAGPAGSAPMLYRIAPNYVTLEFVVRNMWGAFSTTGRFTRFSGDMLLDFDTPQNSRVDVTADSASIHTAWDNANRMLLSADYLNPAQFPSVHYVSQSVESLGPDHVILYGRLTLRGVTCPLDLDAHLEKKRDEPGQGPVADFVVKGEFKRADYGMTADYPLVARDVALHIQAHILLAPKDRDAR